MPAILFPRPLESGAVPEPEGTVLPSLIVSIARSGWLLGHATKSILGNEHVSRISHRLRGHHVPGPLGIDQTGSSARAQPRRGRDGFCSIAQSGWCVQSDEHDIGLLPRHPADAAAADPGHLHHDHLRPVPRLRGGVAGDVVRRPDPRRRQRRGSRRRCDEGAEPRQGHGRPGSGDDRRADRRHARRDLLAVIPAGDRRQRDRGAGGVTHEHRSTRAHPGRGRIGAGCVLHRHRRDGHVLRPVPHAHAGRGRRHLGRASRRTTPT